MINFINLRNFVSFTVNQLTNQTFYNPPTVFKKWYEAASWHQAFDLIEAVIQFFGEESRSPRIT